MRIIIKSDPTGTDIWFILGQSNISKIVISVSDFIYKSDDLHFVAYKGDTFKVGGLPAVIVEKFGYDLIPVIASSKLTHFDSGVSYVSPEAFNKVKEDDLDLLDLLKSVKSFIETVGGDESIKHINNLDKSIEKLSGSHFGTRYTGGELIDILESFKNATKSGKTNEWVSNNVKRHICDEWVGDVQFIGDFINITSLRPNS